MRISGYRQTQPQGFYADRARHTRYSPEPQTYDAEYTVEIAAGNQTEQVDGFRLQPQARIPPWAVSAYYQSAQTPAHNRKSNIIDVFT